MCKMNEVFKVIFLILVMSFIVAACANKVSEVDESETYFVPEAANQFAMDKETETSAIEETKAHHIYPEDFTLPVSKELSIGEKQFLTRINYIKNHIDDFKDTTIIVEGMYGWYTSWDKTFEFPMVYRNGPGCCGDDQYGGFFLVNIDQTAYQIDDWIEVKGKPFIYEHTDSEGELQKYLFLLVEEVKVKSVKERRAEMVND